MATQIGALPAPAIMQSVDLPISSGHDSKPGLAFHAAFGSLCILIFATAMDAMMLAPAIPIVSQELGGTATEAFWAGTSFLLASTVSQLTFGSMSQTFGRKSIILVAIVFFAVGSTIAAVATGFTLFLIGRTVQGMGAGGIMSLTEILITDLVPLRHRGTWFGYQSAVAAIGTVLGPILGGVFADTIGWRWIFWINLPLSLFGFVATVIFLKLHKVLGSFKAKVVNFDWTGVFLFTAAATSTLIAISWGDSVFPWSSWQSILPLVLGILGLVGFVFYEAKIPKNPIVRLSIFEQRTAQVSYLGTVIHGIMLWCLLYYITLYYQVVQGFSATLSGVAVFPETLTVAPTSLVVGILVSRLGFFRWAIWAGWFLSVLGMGLLYLLGPTTPVWQWAIINLVPGIGLGMLFSSLAYATQTGAKEKDVAYTASMYTFSRAFGQSIGVATGGAILQSQLDIKMRAYPDLANRAANFSTEATALVEYVKTIDEGSPERVMIVEAYADSLKVIWAVMAGLGVVALILSGWTKALDINRPPETEQGFRGQSKKKDVQNEMVVSA